MSLPQGVDSVGAVPEDDCDGTPPAPPPAQEPQLSGDQLAASMATVFWGSEEEDT